MYKSFDLFSQLVLLFVILLCLIFEKDGTITSVSIIAFAVVQINSLVVHWIYRKQFPKEIILRKIHLAGTAIVLIIMLYGLLKPAKDKYDMDGLGIIFYTLVPAALIALFYTVITFLEWKKLKNRP